MKQPSQTVDGALRATKNHLSFKNNNHTMSAVRKFHSDMLQKAVTELKTTDESSFSKRSISRTMLAVNKLISENLI